MLKLSHGRYIDGIWVGAFCDKKKLHEILQPVEQALTLIKTYDPLRYRRLIHDLDRIWINLLPGHRGEFRRALKLCVLDERFVIAKGTQPAEIASTIVHEATHARLMQCGIGYQPDLRARVEAVCFRRQRAFATTLPNGAQARGEAERSLEGYPSDFWADESFRARHVQGSIEALRYLGKSDRFIRAVLRLHALFRRINQVVKRQSLPFGR